MPAHLSWPPACNLDVNLTASRWRIFHLLKSFERTDERGGGRRSYNRGWMGVSFVKMCWTSAYKKGGAYSKALLSSWCMFGNETALNIRRISQARFLFYFGVFCCFIFPTSDFLIEPSCVLFLVSQSDLCIHPVLSPPQPFVILYVLCSFLIFLKYQPLELWYLT